MAIEGGRTIGRRSQSRLQGTLVGVQIAVCLVLMIAASLLLRGLYAAQTTDPGFRYENIAVASLALDGYDANRAIAFNRQLVERVRALPGVESVARVMLPPLSEGNVYASVGLPGQEGLFPIDRNNVSADYFAAVEIPIVRGRAFTAGDETGTSTAAIVTESTARRLWPERDPIGQKLVIETEEDGRRQAEIVGVARDAQVRTIGATPQSYVYLPASPSQTGLQLLARSRGDYASAAAAIRREVAALDPGVVVRIAPLVENLEVWRGLARVVSTLAVALGAIALVLAVVGVYGVVRYTVGRRMREIGVRVALGAQPRDVVSLVLKRTMWPLVSGAAAGLLVGMTVSRALSSVLFGVPPTDPVAFLFASVVVVGGALAAGILPARRASQTDPNAVLHSD